MTPTSVVVRARRIRLCGRAGAVVAASTSSPEVSGLETLFGELARTLDGRGLRGADIVRNRLFAASRAGRDAASQVRFGRLRGSARCATSSYIDLERFPDGHGAAMETLAIAGAGDRKLAVEHEPAQPPCRFVIAGDLVFFSGLTSQEADFGRQLEHIQARLGDELAVAAERLGRPVRPTHAAAWIHRSVDLAEWPALAGRVGLTGLGVRIRRCDGYSKPGKLIELEVDGRAERSLASAC